MNYTFDQLTDSQKQIIAERWCSEIAHFTLQNTLVEYILKQGWEDSEAPFCYDDITNYKPTGTMYIDQCQYELTKEDRDKKLKFYEDMRDSLECDATGGYYDSKFPTLSDEYNHYDEICDDLESMAFEDYPEIFQWFHCSEYACRKLDEADQCTLNGSFWGRESYGQAIYLDTCIQKIAFDHYCCHNSLNISEETIKLHKFDQASFWNL